MKQTKKLTRAHYSYLKSKGIKQEIVDNLRFYRVCNGEYIFVYNGKTVKVERGELVEVQGI